MPGSRDGSGHFRLDEESVGIQNFRFPSNTENIDLTQLANSLAQLPSAPDDEVSDFPLAFTFSPALALGRAERDKRIRNARISFGRN
jgi:hypothetical protein